MMNKRTLLFLFSGLIAVGLPIYFGSRNAARSAEIGNPQAAADAGNAFGTRLFKTVVDAQPKGNVLLSPTSLYLALAMTENGAGGATKSTINQTLSLTAMRSKATEDAANASDSLLIHALTDGKDAGVTLSIADAIWSDRSAPFAPAFLQSCRDSYAARATSLDFGNPTGAAGAINAWVRQNTNGKIAEIVTPSALSNRANVVLTNAVYFKGAWGHAFQTRQTANAVFHRPPSDGGNKTVRMMHASLPVGYLHLSEFESVRLPYGRGRFAFYGFLPPAGTTPESLMPTLTPERFRKVERQMIADAGDSIDVKLPRFKVAFDASMSGSLKRMGMGLAFSPAADFKPMGLPHDCIGDIVHKAVLDVDESGSEAAAATAVIMRTTAQVGVRHVPPAIVFDRPFLCAIVDDQTGAILFEGIVRDPQR